MSDCSVKSRSDVRQGRCKLAACAAVTAMMWLAVLPAVGRRPSVRRAIEQRQAQGVDTGAMFYTDLDVMDEVLERNDEFQRRHPRALWRISGDRE